MVNRAQQLKQKLPSVRAILRGLIDVAQLQKFLSDIEAVERRSVSLEEWKTTTPLLPNTTAVAVAKESHANIDRLSKATTVIAAWQPDGDKLQLNGEISGSMSSLEQIHIAFQRGWKSGIAAQFSGLDDLGQLITDVKGGKLAAEKLKKAAILGRTLQEVQLPRVAERDK